APVRGAVAELARRIVTPTVRVAGRGDATGVDQPSGAQLGESKSYRNGHRRVAGNGAPVGQLLAPTIRDTGGSPSAGVVAPGADIDKLDRGRHAVGQGVRVEISIAELPVPVVPPTVRHTRGSDPAGVISAGAQLGERQTARHCDRGRTLGGV